ncbi:hypothetical protein JCM11641_006333 [Rhodosporidiobolus odoratus]
MDQSEHSVPKLFTLPPETLLHALSFATPQACSRFSTTCTLAHSLAASPSLWRQLHQSLFDPPHPPLNSSSTYHYPLKVQQRTRAQSLLNSLVDPASTLASSNLPSLLETLVDLAKSRADSPHSRNQALLTLHFPPTSSHLLALHPTFSRNPTRNLRSNSRDETREKGKGKATDSASAWATRASVAQLASHLHTLATPSPLALASPSIRTAAREIVYEKANYTRLTGYGPFMSDGSGRVDWIKVEALAMVMKANMEDAMAIGWADGLDSDEGETVVPTGWSSTRKGSAGSTRTDPEGRDWAGVESQEWRGTYAFLHFPIFHHFNAHRSGLLQPSLADEHEAVGDCMSLNLKLLPEGEWPDELDVPDLSAEALERALEESDGSDDEDYIGSGVDEVGGEEDSSSDYEDSHFATNPSASAGPSTRTRRASVSSAPATTPPGAGSSRLPESTANSPLLPDNPSNQQTQGAPSLSDAEGDAEEDENDVTLSSFRARISTSLPGPAPLLPGPALPGGFIPCPPPTTFAPSTPSTRIGSTISTAPSDSTSTFEAEKEKTPHRPNLAFSGTSTPLAFRGNFTTAAPHMGQRPSDRTIRGTVALTPEGVVRWKYVIRYGGSDQWELNGVQCEVGNRQGVLGVWASADRAEEGPCGPFWCVLRFGWRLSFLCLGMMRSGYTSQEDLLPLPMRV